MNTHHLTCYLLPGNKKFCQPFWIPHYEKTILFWRDTIQSALREEKNFTEADALSDHHFTENDEAVTLFHDNNPIGLFMFRWVETPKSTQTEMTMLAKRFSKTMLDYLCHKNLNHLMLMGQLAVHPDWRRSSKNIGISDLLMGFALKRFLESNAHALLTTTRNNRSTNNLCYRQGGQKFGDNAKVFHVDSDLVYFERHFVKPIACETQHATMETLWKTKVIAKTK